MTRDEFIETITIWDELYDFCNEYQCYLIDDLFSADSRDEFVIDEAREFTNWEELLGFLESIITGYDYYYRNDWGEWVGLDEGNFNEFHQDVLDWGDENGIWDEDESGDEDVLEESIDEDDFEIDQEPISINELVSVCTHEVQHIKSIQKDNENEEAEALVNLFFI